MTFTYVVTGCTGIFAGLTGTGFSEGGVVTAPSGFVDGFPIFAAACDRVQPGPGVYCDRGAFQIPEPNPLALLLTAGLFAFFARPSSRPSR